MTHYGAKKWGKKIRVTSHGEELSTDSVDNLINDVLWNLELYDLMRIFACAFSGGFFSKLTQF